MVTELKCLSPFDPDHLPEEILLTEAFHRRFPDLPQVACFDTTFHHDLPRVAQMLPIPRRYEAQGVRRYGSTDCRMRFWSRNSPVWPDRSGTRPGHPCPSRQWREPGGRALRQIRRHKHEFHAGGRGADEHSFRDLDPGLVWYLARTENMSAKQFNEMVNLQSGLLGISETSSDMRDLLKGEARDVRAAEAVALFCYQVKNGLAHLQRRWVEWTRWCSLGALERTRPQSGSGFVTGWDSLGSNWKTSETLQTKA